MSDDPVPRPHPLFVAACIAPILLVALLELLREAGVWDAGLSTRALLAVGLLVTIPPLTVALGWSAMARRAKGISPEVVQAFEAVARAEQAAALAMQAVAQAEARVADASLSREPGQDAARRRRARALAAAALLAAGLVVVAGVAVAFSMANRDLPPVHEHAAFAVFVNGTQVDYELPAFDFALHPYQRAHQHVGEGFPGTIHMEGAPGVTLAEFFDRGLDTRLAPDGIWLDAAAHGGHGYRGNDTDGLHVFVVHPGGEWMVAPGGPAYQPQNHDRILVTFGPLDVTEILKEEAAVPVRFPS